MPEFIFNTTVLSNFAAAGRLDMLAERYRGLAFTTIAVVQQLETVDASGWLRILAPESAVEHRLRSEFDLSLDPGEASCVALAISRGLTFVTDDLAARRQAEARREVAK